MKRADAAALIVCEKSMRWSVLLRRFGSGRKVLEARSLFLANELVEVSPASFVCVADSTLYGDDSFLALSRWEREFPLMAWGALVSRNDPGLERLLLSLGAQFVVTNYAQLPPLLGMAERHFRSNAQTSTTGSSRMLSAHEWANELQGRLPWQSSRRT